jgi:uncharacterized protein (TIGR02271 family)
MGKTAVGLYETSTEAQQVLNELVQAGFDRSNIHIMLGDQSTRQLREWYEEQPATAGTMGSRQSGDASSRLVALGVPRDDSRYYEEALHRGDALVSVSTSDNRINQAVDIMERHNILDIRERMRNWGAATGQAAQDRTLQTGEETTLPVIEEEVRVGKREVERGGVRVRTHVSETPVEETVNLRQERVEVERRPVDRPVGTGDMDRLRDQTIEVREKAEEAVVDKQARVVEEVVVRKEADTRQERVQDTVRRTDVEVEKLGEQNLPGWDRFNNEFRTHYSTRFGTTGRDFSYYEPAYRYGYSLASRPEYRGRNWSQIEAEARRDWESRNQGPWEDFKDSVRYAWQRVTS